jgi:hypothetical protein
MKQKGKMYAQLFVIVSAMAIVGMHCEKKECESNLTGVG